MSAVDSARAVSAICGLFTSGNTDAWRSTTWLFLHYTCPGSLHLRSQL